MLQNSNTNVLSVFFDEPTKEHYLIEISRKAKLAHTSIKKCLNVLKRNGLIIERIEKKGKRNFPIYIANTQNPLFKTYKKIGNISQLLDSGLIELLRDKTMPKSIIVFGSYSRGEDTETSDIDIFVESKEQTLAVSNFESKLKRKIQLHFKSRFKEYPSELKNNIINGNILYGYLEVFE